MGLIGWLVSIGCMLIGVAVGIWGLTEINRLVPIWFVGFPGALCLLVAAGFEAQDFAARQATKPVEPPPIALAPSADRPLVLPPNIGRIHVTDAGGRPMRPYMQFDVQNFGKTTAIMRRVQGKFMMLPLPLTKENFAASNTGVPGQTEIASWTNSSTLGVGQSIQVDPFGLPPNIKIEVYEGYGRPRLDIPEQLFLFLTIEYEDIDGGAWLSFSCWKYEHPSHGDFARFGGKEWNYEKKVN